VAPTISGRVLLNRLLEKIELDIQDNGYLTEHELRGSISRHLQSLPPTLQRQLRKAQVRYGFTDADIVWRYAQGSPGAIPNTVSRV
jgi:hypothetical protein